MELTKFQKIMKITGLLYALTFIFTATVFFLFLPDLLFKMVNMLSDIISGGKLPHYPMGENKFWLSMTISMMSGVTITSLLIWKDVKANFNMAIPLFTMKFFSAIFGLSFFLLGNSSNNWNALANLVIFITDFPLGIFMLFLYKKVKAGE
jgi:hypothetical protein